ncbi:hypothetical protein [Aphanothece sacrum]|uniref:ATPase n=1 Tax=Aphanothece sacrum FPU1 TaxID=1920663 RepID=A0A401IHN7_APHSA|nr:hypothetical protein [Aphanothece sacrum]GBF80802.1 ATPase [Aphanothece sacrum FPU1]GBF83297.1 ATPase [Aphanothece sacrum FPU3]
MDVKQVSQWMDEQVFQQSGKRLDDVQKAIIDGSFEGKSYKNIGSECNRKRYLVRKINQDKILFDLSPVFKEYLITCY